MLAKVFGITIILLIIFSYIWDSLPAVKERTSEDDYFLYDRKYQHLHR